MSLMSIVPLRQVEDRGVSENDSCQLTPVETALIQRYLGFYRALDTEERLPATEAQRHFVAVCRCEAKAQSPHEIAYVKYRMLVNSRRDEATDARQGIDEFEQGVPKPGWFSDEGWKRMRGQYLSNSD
jgi:uncharacterized protein YifE (UPF0438 family)